MLGCLEECRGVGSLALERGEFRARIWWCDGECLPKRTPLPEQRAEIHLLYRWVGGVDGELLGARSAQRVRQHLERIAAELRAGVFGSLVSVSADDVEVVADSSAGKADVAEFSVEGVVAQEECTVAGQTLGLVGGGGVAVGEVAAVEVLGRDLAVPPGVEADGQRPGFGVDGGDGAEAAVGESAASVVAEREDSVAGLEGAFSGGGELGSGELVVDGHAGSGDGVELVDVDPSGGDHLGVFAGEGGGPPVGDDLLADI